MNDVAYKHNLPVEIVDLIYKQLHLSYMNTLKSEIEIQAIRFKMREMFRYIPFFDIIEEEIDYLSLYHIIRNVNSPFYNILDDLVMPHSLQYLTMALSTPYDFYFVA